MLNAVGDTVDRVIVDDGRRPRDRKTKHDGSFTHTRTHARTRAHTRAGLMAIKFLRRFYKQKPKPPAPFGRRRFVDLKKPRGVSQKIV